VASPLLVSFPNWLGDAVLATGLLASLGRLPEPPVVDVCGNAIALAIAAGHPAVRRTRLYERHGAHRRPRAFLQLARELGREGYAAHVVLPSTPSAALLARWVGAPVRAGFEGPGRGLCLTHRHRRGRRGTAHLLQEYRAVLALVAPAAPAAEPEVHTSPAARAAARALVGPGEYVVLAPGATFGPAKRWPAERFAAVGRELGSRIGGRIVVVGGPGDLPVVAAVGQALAARPGPFPPIDLAGRTDLPTLAAVLAGARVVVANDSGPMHLARSVGAPTVGIFGSTEPKWTAPRGGQVVTAADRPRCAPCYRRTCPIAVQCLARIPVSAVLAAVDRVWSEGDRG
jgi:heptosyltransferase-2